jgi:hypothetical protein
VIAIGSCDGGGTSVQVDAAADATVVDDGTNESDVADVSPSGPLAPCQRTADCAEPLVCLENLCLPPDCVEDSDCPVQWICIDNACRHPEDASGPEGQDVAEDGNMDTTEMPIGNDAADLPVDGTVEGIGADTVTPPDESADPDVGDATEGEINQNTDALDADSGICGPATSFLDDFSNGLGNWLAFGSPASTVVSNAFGRDHVFDNNGDPNCNSGVATSVPFDLSGGFVLTTQTYLDKSSSSGCWLENTFGTSTKSTVTNVCGDSGEWSTDLSFTLVYEGDACWGTPAEYRNHAYLKYSYPADDGTGQGLGYADLKVADQYVGGWHEMKITVSTNRIVEFSVDGVPIYQPAKKLDPTVLTDAHVVLTGRSSGSAGKTFNSVINLGCAAPPSCVPACGDAICGPDGCGGDCGSCLPNQICTSGKCVCVPKSCGDVGAKCGTIDDGCGGMKDCQECPVGMVCSGNKCLCSANYCQDHSLNAGDQCVFGTRIRCTTDTNGCLATAILEECSLLCDSSGKCTMTDWEQGYYHCRDSCIQEGCENTTSLGIGGPCWYKTDDCCSSSGGCGVLVNDPFDQKQGCCASPQYEKCIGSSTAAYFDACGKQKSTPAPFNCPKCVQASPTDVQCTW